MTEKEFLETTRDAIVKGMKHLISEEFDKLAVCMAAICGRIDGRVGALPKEKP